MLTCYTSGFQPWMHFPVTEGSLKEMSVTDSTSRDFDLIGHEWDLRMNML